MHSGIRSEGATRRERPRSSDERSELPRRRLEAEDVFGTTVVTGVYGVGDGCEVRAGSSVEFASARIVGSSFGRSIDFVGDDSE